MSMTFEIVFFLLSTFLVRRCENLGKGVHVWNINVSNKYVHTHTRTQMHMYQQYTQLHAQRQKNRGTIAQK